MAPVPPDRASHMQGHERGEGQRQLAMERKARPVPGLRDGRDAEQGQTGWLFGLAFGFLCWMAGPVTALEWVMDRPVITGPPAQGLFFAYLLWGLLVGLLFPRVHWPLQARLDDVERKAG